MARGFFGRVNATMPRPIVDRRPPPGLDEMVEKNRSRRARRAEHQELLFNDRSRRRSLNRGRAIAAELTGLLRGGSSYDATREALRITAEMRPPGALHPSIAETMLIIVGKPRD